MFIMLIMFALSVTVYEIFIYQIKFQKFDLETVGRGREGEKLDLRHSTGNGCIYIDDFFRIYLPSNIHLRKSGHRWR